MTRKMRDHPELQPGETAIEAVYGLGRTMLAAADSVSGQHTGSHRYSSEYDRATGGSAGTGRAAAIEGNGVLAVTDRRLLFFRKRFAIGTPRHLVAAFALVDVAACRYDRPMVVVEAHRRVGRRPARPPGPEARGVRRRGERPRRLRAYPVSARAAGDGKRGRTTTLSRTAVSRSTARSRPARWSGSSRVGSTSVTISPSGR